MIKTQLVVFAEGMKYTKDKRGNYKGVIDYDYIVLRMVNHGEEYFINVNLKEKKSEVL